MNDLLEFLVDNSDSLAGGALALALGLATGAYLVSELTLLADHLSILRELR